MLGVTLAGLLAATAIAEAADTPRYRAVAVRTMMRGYALEPLAAGDTIRPAEHMFLEKAVATGRLQMRLAELGASQASSSDVRTHAEQLKADTRQLVDALTALIQKKNSTARQVVESPAMTEIYTTLSSKSGPDFDVQFVRVMSELHEGTIALFEQAASEMKDADVRDLAGAQLPMLRAHRNRIVELKKIFD
ncbi:MAG: DUF4142 domain-containing protein [Verrucomicrobiota bacterium]